MRIFTNATAKKTVRNAFHLHMNDCQEVFFASPFFSYSEMVEEVLSKGSFVHLIVRLGPATSAADLKKILLHPNVHVRFYTSPKFHSKLYVFGEKTALVGSANLTQSGMNSNQEICAEVPREDEAFDDLVKLFHVYWDDAEALTPDLLEKYDCLSRKHSTTNNSRFENEIIEQFGDIEPVGGVQVGKKKRSKDRLFLSAYRRTYQEFITAYEEVRDIYLADGRRQQPEEICPLRIEVDQFLSFVRETYSKGVDCVLQPFRTGEERKDFVREKMANWFNLRWNYLDEHIPSHFPRIQNRLGSAEAIKNASMDELLDGLDVCHSFHERLRYFKGGHETHLAVFKESNELNQLRKVLTYLLYGKEDYVTRMANCIFDPQYDLNEFGRSGIQELLGWVNKEGIPICNTRTVKALRYLGYRVAVF